MKIIELNLGDIMSRERSCEGAAWILRHDPDGSSRWLITGSDGIEREAWAGHDSTAAPVGDLEFIAKSRGDVRYLLSVVGDGAKAEADRLSEISRRCDAATPPPWRPINEESNNVESIIWIPSSKDEDLYLKFDGRSMSGKTIEFVGYARQDVLVLLGFAYRALLREQMPSFLRDEHRDVLRDA